MKLVQVALWSLCLLSAPSALAAEPGNVTDYIHQTQSGDTLSKLAKQMLDTPARWKDVAVYNKLEDANLIEIGQPLHIRPVWLRAQAGGSKGPADGASTQAAKVTVEAITGAVKSNGKPVRVGDELAAGLKLETASGGAVRLRLPDGSIVNMLEQTALQLEKLEHGSADSFKTVLRLLTGQVEAFKKKYPQGQSDLAFRAHASTIGVRGTHFRMRQTEGKDFAEIEDGQVSFEAEKTPQVLALAGGQGSVANGKDAAEVIQLLPAPAFPQLPTAFETPYVEWTMPEAPGTRSFAGELAQNEEFSKEVKSFQTNGKRISFVELPNGKYWLRLRAVDQYGLQGMEGKVAFTVQARPRIMALIKAYIAAENIQLRWIGRGANASYHVQVADNQDFTAPLLDTETTEMSADMPRPASGRYFVRVRGITADRHADYWDAPVMFAVP